MCDGRESDEWIKLEAKKAEKAEKARRGRRRRRRSIDPAIQTFESAEAATDEVEEIAGEESAGAPPEKTSRHASFRMPLNVFAQKLKSHSKNSMHFLSIESQAI